MSDQDNDEPSLRSAEDWLTQRGVARHALIVRTEEPTADDVAEAIAAAQPPAPSLRLVGSAEEELAHQERIATEQTEQRVAISDAVLSAMSYIRKATLSTPLSEGRIRAGLLEREHPEAVINLALVQARKDRLVDDLAYATSLVEESLAKGHAGARIRDDLRRRDFDNALIVEVMARADSPDPEAAAFAVARDRARSLSGLPPETAHRRLVAYLARRGHPEGLARKVARQVLWVDREAQQTAEH